MPVIRMVGYTNETREKVVPEKRVIKLRDVRFSVVDLRKRFYIVRNYYYFNIDHFASVYILSQIDIGSDVYSNFKGLHNSIN